VDLLPRCWGNAIGFGGKARRRLTGVTVRSNLPARRTRRRESEPDGTDPPEGKGAPAPRPDGGSGPWEQPRRCVRGGPQSRWPDPPGTESSGSATGTRVSRPGGTASRLRATDRSARTRHPPEPDHRRSLWSRRAPEGTGGGTGTGVPGRPGPSTAVGRRGARWTRVPPGTGGRAGSGSGGRRIIRARVRVPPFGEVPRVRTARRGDPAGGCGTTERLRGVDRFAGRLLGAVSAFSGSHRRDGPSL